MVPAREDKPLERGNPVPPGFRVFFLKNIDIAVSSII